MPNEKKRIVWDEESKRFFQTGVNHGVLFPKTGANGAYAAGVAWNGLTSCSITPSGGEDSKLYADNIPYLTLKSTEEVGGTIECYTYPDEWSACNGEKEIAKGVFATCQEHKKFGLCFTTKVGNDVVGDSYGEKLHIIYNASANPSERSFTTINESPEAITFSYTYTTVADTTLESKGYKPMALIEIDTTKLEGGKDNQKYKDLCDILYGKDGTDTEAGIDPRLPSLVEIYEMFNDTNTNTNTNTTTTEDING